MDLVSYKADEKDKRVKIVTFGDPSEGNPLDGEIFSQLTKTFEDIAQELSKEPLSGAVVFSPTPTIEKKDEQEIILRQSVGAKLNTLIAGDKPLPENARREYIRLGLDTVSRINEIRLNEVSPVAVYGIVSGEVMGGGLEILYGISDFVLIGESTSFLFPEIRLNFTLNWGGAHYLRKHGLNEQQIKYLATGNKIDARTAYNWGIAIGVYPDNKLEEEALKLARGVASRDGLAVYHNLKVPDPYIVGEEAKRYLEEIGTELAGRETFVNQVTRSMRVLNRMRRKSL